MEAVLIIGVVHPAGEEVIFEMLRDAVGEEYVTFSLPHYGESVENFAEWLEQGSMRVYSRILIPAIVEARRWDEWAHDLYATLLPQVRRRVRIVGPGMMHRVDWQEVPLAQICAVELLQRKLALEFAR